MGAAAAATVSKGKAVKVGKRYDWGSERPGVLERRVQQRKEQMPKKLADVEERVARFRAAELAKVEQERLYVEEQEALLKAHRERVKSKAVFRRVSSYPVEPGIYPQEEIDALRARMPGVRLSDFAARVILDDEKRGAQAEEVCPGADMASVSLPPNNTEVTNTRSEADTPRQVVPEPITQHAAKPAEAPKAVISDKPKAVPVHIEAKVTISSPSDEGEVDQDSSDFDYEAWNEGDEYPRDQFERVRNPDGSYCLRPFADVDEANQEPPSPELLALWNRQRELKAETDSLIAQYGHGIGAQPQEVIDRLTYLDKEGIAVDIQIEKLLDG
jgi:hypothetical protein